MDHEIERAFDHIKSELKEYEARVRALETKTVVNERDIKMILDDMAMIKSNTTWILRLVIGSIVTSLIVMLIRSA